MNYALIKNASKNIYYGICISFVQADAGHLGRPLDRAVPLDLHSLGVTRSSVTQIKFVNTRGSQRRTEKRRGTSAISRIEEGFLNKIL